jgi:hypothetical protein
MPAHRAAPCAQSTVTPRRSTAEEGHKPFLTPTQGTGVEDSPSTDALILAFSDGLADARIEMAPHLLGVARPVGHGDGMFPNAAEVGGRARLARRPDRSQRHQARSPSTLSASATHRSSGVLDSVVREPGVYRPAALLRRAGAKTEK